LVGFEVKLPALTIRDSVRRVVAFVAVPVEEVDVERLVAAVDEEAGAGKRTVEMDGSVGQLANEGDQIVAEEVGLQQVASLAVVLVSAVEVV
jgi:hypothetical protein